VSQTVFCSVGAKHLPSPTKIDLKSLFRTLPSPQVVRIHTAFLRSRSREAPELKPRDRLPLALRAAYLTLHRRSDTQFAKLGLTADQFVLLSTLAAGDALTQRELAARMPSDPSTVRAMLVLLERQGFVARDPHPTDGRARTVTLTALGRRKYRQAWKSGQDIRDQMISTLTAAETQSLVTLLQRVSESMDHGLNVVTHSFSTGK
jgi:DNA-binding MarR family transcriptional regulator